MKTTLLQFFAGIVGSFLLLLLLMWGSEALFHPGGHAESEPAYVIEVEEEAPAETAASETTGEAGTTTEEAAAPAEPAFADLYAAADVEAGKKVFGKCKACHKLEEGKNATGPYLFGIVGRAQSAIEGFRYSDIMLTKTGTWTPEEIDLFLTDVKDYAPGTKMSFKGVKGAENRANLIAYLATFGN